MDRGKGRVSKGMGVLSAMRFVAWKLELKCLRQSLDCSLVRVWSSRDKWQKGHTREAIPLSLQMVKNLEKACSSAAEDDLWLILCFLLMIFGSLRWSDAQRIDLASVVCDKDCLYGWSWRCKQDAGGMPWGVVCEGVCGSNWGHAFFHELSRLRSSSPSRDFLIGRSGSPIGYSTALAHFRRCLVKYCGLTLAAAAEYTMHSMKCTFLTWAQQVGVGSRDCSAYCLLSAHVENRCEESLFTPDEVEVLRSEVLSFLSSKGFACDDSIVDNQPFLLSVWQALCTLTSDQDVELPRLLLEGVSTGIVQPIPPSGVWEEVAEPVAVEQDLRVHLEPWRSASDNLALAKKLVMDDVAAGHAFVLPGGEAEARARWGDRIAAGKFGVVQVPGKNPRLIGDGSVSGANAASQVLEKVRNPSLHAVQRFLSCVDRAMSWCLCSFDVKGAHKLVLAREYEQGYSCFVLDGV
ncbi:unnamed protein product, partial [Symbiodinium natans]